MKQMFLATLLLLSTLSVAAQNEKNDSIQEKFFNAKVRELVYRLDISDEQKAKFVPIYRRYNEEMRTAMGAPMKKRGDRKGAKAQQPQPKHRTSADVAAAQKKMVERQQKAQAVQLKYLDEFAQVLDARQLSRFFDVEKKIQKKLFERKNHPRNKFDKGFKHQPRKGMKKSEKES